MMLKAIHASEDREAANEKARSVIKKLKKQKIPNAARKVEDSIGEPRRIMIFQVSTGAGSSANNPLEHIMREVRRRTRVVGAFPDGNSVLMLVAGRLRHFSGTRCGFRRYLNMSLLTEFNKEELAT